MVCDLGCTEICQISLQSFLFTLQQEIKSEDPDSDYWVPTKFQFNKEKTVKTATKKQQRNERHASIQAKRMKNKDAQKEGEDVFLTRIL